MNYISGNERRQFVLDQLALYSGTKKVAQDSTFILCPYHAEQTPSGRVYHGVATRSPGYFRCYGCGHKANWNDLAPRIGLKPFVRQKPADEYMNLSLIAEKEDPPFCQEELVLTDLPRDKVWRQIKTNLLIELGAKKCRVRHPEFGLLKPCLYLPVVIRKELRGYIKARFTKHPDYPSYINAKGSWSKTHGLFPFDYSIQMAKRLGKRTIVLVEGQRDALRLIQNGIPAMCILGTQSWSDTKARQLELSGITRLIIMMDGDCAGKAATDKLVVATETMFSLTVVKLWAMKTSPYLQFAAEDEPSKAAKAAGVTLWDPGCVPQRIIDNIKSRFFTRS